MENIISSKVEKRQGALNNTGYFAIEDIKKGEMIFIRGGHLLTKNELFSSSVINSYFPISDDYYLAARTKDEEENIKLYINHSCSPNCGIKGEITFVAIRDIKKGEEITTDYAFIDNEDYSFQCTCGADNCRGIITGYDWKIQDLQEKYYDYFAQYLKDKIDIERSKNNEK